MVWACSMGEEGKVAYRVLAENHEGRRPLGRPGHRWDDNVIMDLEEVDGLGLGLD